MKKYSILCAVLCATLITFAGANATVKMALEQGPAELTVQALQARSITKSFLQADIQKLDFRGIAPVRDVLYDEGDYEPNDWDGAAWPPSPWGGLIGALPAGETAILNGALDTIGFDGWYTGDNDLFGFGLPDEGIMDITVAFSEECGDETNIYNVWFLGEADDGGLYILDMNFPYPSVSPVICPFETSWAIDPYGEVMDGVYFINQFYVYIGGVEGDPTAYTVTWLFTPCDDLDGDAYYDDTCGGSDCDDEDPFVHPCALEIAGNGFDEDCSGADRVLTGAQVRETEPNDDDTMAQDLGALSGGSPTVEISGNFCSSYDYDYYMVDLPAANVTLTLTLTYEGITEEMVCWAVDGVEYGEDFWFGIMPGDMDEDGYYDVGDYIFLVTLGFATDADGDTYFSEETCGTDCDDTDADVHPCAVEVCGDGIDQDCVGMQHWLGEEIFPVPDGDLPCGIPEEEPNDDISAGIAHQLGALEEGFLTVHGDISAVGMEGDYDFYQYEMAGPGFYGFNMMFDCDNDYDMLWLGYYDPDGPEGTEYTLDWYIFGGDAWLYIPETMGGVFLADGGWEFPMDMAVWIMGYDGLPGYYDLEIYYDAACTDGDGDGYGGGMDPDFYDIWGYEAECDGIDCDDTDPLVHPGMIESQGMGNCANGKDDDCAGLTDGQDLPDCADPGPCPATIIPVSGSPVAFYLIPALAMLFVIRRFRR